MTSIMNDKITKVWLVLIGATLFSVFFAENSTDSPAMILVIFALAMLKAHLVIVHYMEVNEAPLHWRRLYKIWAIVTGVMLMLGHWPI